MKNHLLPPLLKSVVLWVLYFALSFLYKAVLTPSGNIIGPAGESLFRQGMIAFITALIAGAAEFLIDRKRITNSQSYLFARMLSMVFIPYVFMLIWSFIPAVAGNINMEWLRVSYVNLAAFAAFYFAVLLERTLEEVVFQKGLIILTVLLFTLTLFFTVLLTIQTPVVNIFTDPSFSS
jgi:hypothetical protein